MTTQFRSHNGAWYVASTEQFTTGAIVRVERRNGQGSDVIIVARAAHDPSRDLPYLYSFQDQRAARGAQRADRTHHVDPTATERLFALFERANSAARTQNSGHSGFAVRFALQNTARGLRLELAGANSRYNGQLLALVDQRSSSGRRALYGSLSRNGAFAGNVGPTQVELEIFNEVADVLTRFAADPAGYAAAHGHATGNCCFCGRGLTDERSVAVGYGPICADYFGLPWGEAGAPAFDVAQGSRRQMERLADNAGRENSFDNLPPLTTPPGVHVEVIGTLAPSQFGRVADRHMNARGEIVNRTAHGIETATGEALDGWGRQFGVERSVLALTPPMTEGDESYRSRILAAQRRMAEDGPQEALRAYSMPAPEEAANDGLPTLEEIQNEPNAQRRMAMAAQRASAGATNVMRDSMGRVIVADIRDDRTVVGVVDVQRDPNEPNRVTATVQAPVSAGQVVTTVRRVRPAGPAQRAAAERAEERRTTLTSARERLLQRRAARAAANNPEVAPAPAAAANETVTNVVRRPPPASLNRPLEEDDFIWSQE